MNDPMNPFSEDDYRRINDALRGLNDAIPLLQKCERCGLNVTDAKNYFDHLQQQLLALKREFFQGKP